MDRAVILTGRPVTPCMKDRRTVLCLFHQEDVRLSLDCGLADLHYCTWDIIHQRCIKRTTSVHRTKDRQINDMSSLRTDRPTAWHHAHQWLDPMFLNRGVANTTILLDPTQAGQRQVVKLGQEDRHQEIHQNRSQCTQMVIAFVCTGCTDGCRKES